MSNSLFLHLFLVAPVCQYLLQSGRFSRVRGLLYAVAFLVVLFVATEYQEWQTKPRNLYQILDVDVSATQSELHKANLQMSRKLHPDKNPAPDAQDRFTELNAAYEILSNSEDRYLYDRFGIDVVKSNRRSPSSKDTQSQAITQIVFFYVAWSVLTYLLTLGKSSSSGRTWSFTALVLLGVLEFNMIIANFDFLQSVFPRTTVRDKLDLLHALYPAFMNGCRILSQFTFVDLEEQQRQLLFMLLKTNSDIITTLSQIALAVEKKGGGGAASTQGTNVKTTGKENNLLNADGTGNEVNDELANDADKGPAWRLQRAKVENQKAKQAMQEEQKKKMQIPGWVYMVGMYVLFNYVLK